MTDALPAPATAGRPQASTLPLQGAINRFARTMLATPLVSRAFGTRLVTLYVVGRKSGRRMSIPVRYTWHEGALLVGTPWPWGRNLRTGEPIQLRFKGRRRSADVQVFTAEADVVQRLAVIARGNRTFARSNQIGYDAAGEPVLEDLRQSWAAGARAIQLTLR
jgi:hypothetical protein